MDGRIALAANARLRLKNVGGYTDYTIQNEVGRGGSCIVYDASYSDNLGNYKLVRIKECYPHALKITRTADGALLAQNRSARAFEEAKARFRQAYQKNHDLFFLCRLTNAVANASDICEANGSVYIVSVYMNGRTFADFQGKSLRDCVTLLIGAAQALKQIHAAGYLYLDLKPENILTLEGSAELVQLFDFDSMISLRELKSAIKANDASMLRASCTRGFAAPEQQLGQIRLLGRHSDIYSLGAVLFYALWHRTPAAFDCGPFAQYDWARMRYCAPNYRDGLYRALTDFFHKTLASYQGDRYRDIDEALPQLRKIQRLSDETEPRICAGVIAKNEVFYGRKEELDRLADLLRQTGHGIVSLCGPGGIGKSALVRQYLATRADEWDSVLWLYDQGDLPGMLADDTYFSLNTVHRAREEDRDEYLKRKMRSVSLIAHDRRVLLVLDNFDTGHVSQLELLRDVGWTVLLISRTCLPDGLFPTLRLVEPDDETLSALFEHYSRLDLRDADNIDCFRAVSAAVGRHTLLTELIARQLRKSRMSPRQLRAIIEASGLHGMPTEKIDYIRDQSVTHDTLLHILGQLTDIERLSPQERLVMRLLAPIDMPGIDFSLFRTLTGTASLDCVNDLESAGWVISDGQRICLHPMMQEYVRTWPWTQPAETAADDMMRRLCDMICPAGTRPDADKQFPADYDRLYTLLCLADRLISRSGRVSAVSQRLLCRLLIDAPVDRDQDALRRILKLLEDPIFLDDGSVLRLYETAAYLQSRLYDPGSALEILARMKKYLRKHPSAYYLSAYHRAMAVILHNADQDGNLRKCLYHEGSAIAAAHLSARADAPRQLAACLLDKATTLLSADIRRDEARRLIAAAEPLVEKFAAPTDYERYQLNCVSAMCRAMDGDAASAQALLDAADAIVFGTADSDLSVAEHLIEQFAPINMAMARYARAAAGVREAIALCMRHENIRRYRETVFDAYLFLGNICAMSGEYCRAAAAYDEAERRKADAPYPCELPLCPKEIRDLADAEGQRE